MRYFTSLIIFLFSLSISESCFGQWEPTSGPQGGATICIEKVGDEIWAGTKHGVYTSNDEGQNWNLHPNFYDIFCFGILGFNDTIIVGYYKLHTLDGFTRTSFDGGSTWQPEVHLSKASKPFFPRPQRLSKLNGIILNYENVSPYKSEDYGKTWQKMNFGLDESTWTDIYSVDPNGIIYYCHGGQNIEAGLYYYSIKDKTNSPIKNNRLNINLFLFENSIFALQSVDTINNIGVKYIKRTEDLGVTWDTVFTGSQDEGTYYNVQVVNDTLFILNDTAALVSYNKGQDWERKSSFPPYLKFIDYVQLTSGNFMGMEFYKEIIHLNADFTTSSVKMSGINNQLIRVLSLNKNTLFTSSSNAPNLEGGAPNGTWKSSNFGETWDKMDERFNDIKIHLFKGDTAIFLKDDYYDPFILKSIDNGLNWKKITLDFLEDNNTTYSMEEFKGKLFLSCNYGIFTSNDWGETWTQGNPLSNNLCTSTSSETGYIKKVNGRLFAVSVGGTIDFYSEVQDKWYNVNCINGAYGDGRLFDLNSMLVLSSYGGVYYSTDNGINFKKSKMSGVDKSDFSYSNQPNDLIFSDGAWIGGFGTSGVLYSTNFGDSWSKLPGNNNIFSSGNIVQSNGTLYSGTYTNSVFKKNSTYLPYISGKVYFDRNNNGTKDGTESIIPGIILNTVAADQYSSPNASGYYSIYSDVPSDTLKVHVPLRYLTTEPAFYICNGEARNQDFRIYFPFEIKDLSIDVTNINVFRPGFETDVQITYNNLGNILDSGSVKLVLDPKTSYVNSSTPYDYLSGDTIVWKINNLDFFTSDSIVVRLKTSASAMNGQSVGVVAIFDPVHLDEKPLDNYAYDKDDIVGSYDPNDKTCLQGQYFTPDQIREGEEMQYVIRFQNTGTYRADNVRILDTLSEHLDKSSLRIISNSHPMEWRISQNGILDFYFDNIFLPDSNQNELLSHGFVKYGIKVNKDFTQGESIKNTAHIFFDFNEAIATNTEETLMDFPLNIKTQLSKTNNYLLVYPNPTNEGISIDPNLLTSDNFTIRIIDATGRKISSAIINKNNNYIELNSLHSGLYFGTVEGKNGNLIGKFKFILL